VTTATINLRSDMPVQTVEVMGSDHTIVNAARVSFLNDNAYTSRGLTPKDKGLINFLMREKHMSPFEHPVMTFRIEAPIFVWREFMRHRTFSYNEQSGRYTTFQPDFYCIPPERPVIQSGKPGDYHFEPSVLVNDSARVELKESYKDSWAAYQRMLDSGVAKEVARMALPVATYSTAYVTGNLRNWFQFLTLRTASQAQWEIQQVATDIEGEVYTHFPTAYSAYKEYQ
jgi:thymidylate synthase (FAD)